MVCSWSGFWKGHSSQSRGEYATSGQSNRSYQSSSGSQTNYEDRAAQEAQRRWRAHLDEQQRAVQLLHLLVDGVYLAGSSRFYIQVYYLSRIFEDSLETGSLFQSEGHTE